MRDASFQNFLQATLSDLPRHRLWLRSLSYLEYVGYRKMVKALPYAQLGPEVQRHLSDEIRHSFTFREQADRLGAPALPRDFIEAAEGYFQSLDGAVAQWVERRGLEKPAYHCYLLTSYLIEKRAMQVYPSYQAQTDDAELRAALKSVIREESEHLDYLEGALKPQAWFSELGELHVEEGRFFEAYLSAFAERFEAAA